jgi:hypothetical protein
MDIGLTSMLWLNLVLAGFLLGIGWQLAVAIYDAILWVAGRRRAQP